MAIHTERADERVMIFLDLRNAMSASAKSATAARQRLDIYSLVELLKGGRALTAVYAFDSNHGGAESAFHVKLRNLGIRLFTAELQGFQQKEVDVALATEALWHAFQNSYDTAIIVSGDRDFRPTILKVQQLGKRVEVASFTSAISSSIRMTADIYKDLDRMPILELMPELEFEVS